MNGMKRKRVLKLANTIYKGIMRFRAIDLELHEARIYVAEVVRHNKEIRRIFEIDSQEYIFKILKSRSIKFKLN